MTKSKAESMVAQLVKNQYQDAQKISDIIRDQTNWELLKGIDTEQEEARHRMEQLYSILQ